MMGTLLLAAGWPAAGALAQAVPVGQNPVAGSTLFGSKGCARCHAIDGIGGGVGPDLARLPHRHMPRLRSFFQIGSELLNHLPKMAQSMQEAGIEKPRLEPWEMGDLISFLFALDYFDPPGDAARGAQVFEEKRCVVCHQVGGAGGVVGPELDRITQLGSPIYVATAMWNHGAAMTETMRAHQVARATFNGEELQDLVAYLRTASPQLPQGRVALLPGRPDMGRERFVEKRCSECHGRDGRGGQNAPNIVAVRHRSIMDFAAALWNKEPTMQRAMTRAGIAVPTLRPDEMADLVAYLYSLQYFEESGNPDRGGAHLRSKGCLGCHSLHGVGATTASELSTTEGRVTPQALISTLWNHHQLGRENVGPGREDPTFTPGELADMAAYFSRLTAH